MENIKLVSVHVTVKTVGRYNWLMHKQVQPYSAFK